MSIVSKEDNLVLSSEVSSSYPDEPELQLGLGLSLGGVLKAKQVSSPSPWGQYARILTAKDFPCVVTKAASSSSSSSSSSVTKANVSSGTKRAADSVPQAANGVSNQVVGWPPIKACRMNNLVNQAKSSPTEEFNSTTEKSKTKDGLAEMATNGINNGKENGLFKTSLFVKVNMDGIVIGRKVDLNAHSCYETLAHTLGDMFCKPTSNLSARRSDTEEYNFMIEKTGASKLLDGSSGFVLTYEDKEGDWMLVGDVPWGMFLSSVKRLRIMKTFEANGLAPRFQVSRRQRSKPI